MKIVRKPRFEPPVRDDIDNYSTDQLRALRHATPCGHDALIRLRNSNISRTEIAAEIRWRDFRENCQFWVLCAIGGVAAVAAVLAL